MKRLRATKRCWDLDVDIVERDGLDLRRLSSR